MRWTIRASFLLLLLPIPNAAFSQSASFDVRLAAFDSIRVVVDEMHDKDRAAGFYRSIIQTDTELLLRRYGVPIARNEDYFPFLYVGTNTIPNVTKSGSAFGHTTDVTVEVWANYYPPAALGKAYRGWQGATGGLTEAVGSAEAVIIWLTSSVWTGSKSDREWFREAIEHSVKEFVNAWLATHPD